MNLEFDKEINALLRKAASNAAEKSPVFDSHLDADEIAMFAENALPETARPAAITHFADCDRCRSILSNVVALNAEDTHEPAVAAVPEIKVEAQPSWLAGLFTTKKLAFGFGSLALIFAGFLGIAVYRNMSSGDMELAQANKSEVSEPKSAPAAKENADTSGLAEDNANTNSAAASEFENSDAPGEVPGLAVGNNVISGKDLPARKQVSEDEFSGSRSDLGRLRDKKEDAGLPGADREEADAAGASVSAESKPVSPPPAPAPVTSEVLTTRGATVTPKKSPPGASEKAKSAMDDAPSNAQERAVSTKRRVSGKNFTQRNGVWYDSAYKNQPITGVTRGTAAYQKLDSGLRSIAERLNGTVVVIWKSKAYRIQ